MDDLDQPDKLYEEAKEDYQEAKKDGGTVDWDYLLSRIDSF